MPMFELSKHPTTVNNYTARKEMHGDRRVLAGTMSCETVCHNSVIDLFDPTLRQMLYRKPEPGEQPQGELPIEVSDGLTARRLPHIKPVVWDEKFPGYKAAFESGIKQKDLIELEKVELSKLVFEALDGGSVRINFNLSFQVGWQTSGKLDHLIQEDIDLTLTAPTAEPEPQKDLAAEA